MKALLILVSLVGCASPQPNLQSEVTNEVALRLEKMYGAMENRKYDRCIDLGMEVLQIDPRYPIAQGMIRSCEKARHGHNLAPLRRKIETWKAQTRSGATPIIPDAHLFTPPTQDEWNEIKPRLNQPDR